ncbi:hypothetical protein LUZ60_012483 [Juncus effusus]|nr:hypothetical protein LUZ60_012483 [Juncus effusus]
MSLSVDAMCSSSSSSPAPLSLLPSNQHRVRYRCTLPRNRRIRVACLRLSVEEISELLHNKVLVAATVATAIGQISKPFTSAINGKRFDLRNAIRSGGMPSTHSASVVAAATSLGLERGFSDAIFGMSIVFAAIVMYDAQGVRKEVGNHAKVLNRITSLEKKLSNPKTRISSSNCEETSNLFRSNDELNYSNIIIAEKSDTVNNLKTDLDLVNPLEDCESRYYLLNESVGHTRVQVLVGALLGFVISLIVDITL